MTKNAKMELDAGQNTIKNVKSTSKTAETVQGSSLMGKNSQNKANLNEINGKSNDVKVPHTQKDEEWDDKSYDDDSILSGGSNMSCTNETHIQGENVRQNNITNKSTMFNALRKEEKVRKTVQKQESNDENRNHEHCKGMSIEIKYERDEEHEKEDYVEDVVDKALNLLRKWIQHKAIEGVHDLNKALVEDLGDIEKWMITPKVVCRKTSMIVEIVLQVKTNRSTYQLHHLEKEYCDKNAMHVSTKNTQNAHTKRIGFITSTHVKLASTKYYNKELSAKGQIDKTLFEIKKGNTAEKVLNLKH